MEPDKPGFLDIIQSRVTSRKLLAWTVATVAFFVGTLPSSDWVSITLGYIGIQGVLDIAKTWKQS